jgi:hypothetical protein
MFSLVFPVATCHNRVAVRSIAGGSHEVIIGMASAAAFYLVLMGAAPAASTESAASA